MKIVKLKQKNQFGLAPLSFSEIKTIKDACKEYGKQGSSAAKEIAEKIEKSMGEISI
ncbi:MAG: hypothetical protein OEZ34_02570 [Spirochaetia bacterium]|nr:hypothetical protein [Spirochaetia bacterium]